MKHLLLTFSTLFVLGNLGFSQETKIVVIEHQLSKMYLMANNKLVNRAPESQVTISMVGSGTVEIIVNFQNFTIPSDTFQLDYKSKETLVYVIHEKDKKLVCEPIKKAGVGVYRPGYNPVYSSPGYDGKLGCNPLSNESEVMSEIIKIAHEPDQNSKITWAIQIIKNYCIDTALFEKLLLTLPLEADRLYMIKVGYPFIYDQENIQNLEVFKNPHFVLEFNKFVKGL